MSGRQPSAAQPLEAMDMNVANILKIKGRGVVVEQPTTLIQDVVRDLAERRIGAVVIVEDENRVMGIVSERDVMWAIANRGAACLTEPVGNIMTPNVITCSESDSTTRIMEVMTEGRFRHVPVVADGRLVGIVSIGDIVKDHIAAVEMEANALKTYVAG
ncbi:MAG: CBS domain-containing protein [Hyphomicrobiaceae bacterium]